MRTLVWFRGKDLRVSDHPALASALKSGEVVPFFCLDPYFFAPERAAIYPHRAQYLVESLAELHAAIARLGSRLLVVPGKSLEVVPEIARALEVDRVVGLRWSEPVGRDRDRRVAEALGTIPFELFEGERLVPPGSVLTGAGSPFAVFTPFSRALVNVIEERGLGTVLKPPRELPPLPRIPRAVASREVPVPTIRELGIEPNEKLTPGGETAARLRYQKFLRGIGKRYDVSRNQLDEEGTSRISQDLKFGTLSIRAVWSAALDRLAESPQARRSFTNELAWREFALDVLWHRPEVLDEPYRKEWERFPWRRAPSELAAWEEGRTGYPVVDAAARQLLEEGFVPGRARMIAASFLTKHLMIDFRKGEAHYLRFLTDGDWANNDLGWQWSAGCGVDAQPYFRVFDPVAQGDRFDPSGDWVRRWVPELRDLETKFIHAPWTAPAAILTKAGIDLGRSYPKPIVEHRFARGRFLAAAQGLGGRKKA